MKRIWQAAGLAMLISTAGGGQAAAQASQTAQPAAGASDQGPDLVPYKLEITDRPMKAGALTCTAGFVALEPAAPRGADASVVGLITVSREGGKPPVLGVLIERGFLDGRTTPRDPPETAILVTETGNNSAEITNSRWTAENERLVLFRLGPASLEALTRPYLAIAYTVRGGIGGSRQLYLDKTFTGFDDKEKPTSDPTGPDRWAACLKRVTAGQ
jgi:hypothetical protein